MNKSKKYIDQIRGELKPLLMDISREIHMTEEPVCEICGQIRNTKFLMDIIDMHELYGRHPGLGKGFRHPGVCEPMNIILVHRLCHTNLKHGEIKTPNGNWELKMIWLSERIMQYRQFTEQVQWDDLLQAVRKSKRDYYAIRKQQGDSQ